MGMEGPPGGSQEMVWGRCPQCGGSGKQKEASGAVKTCVRCSGKGQMHTR